MKSFFLILTFVFGNVLHAQLPEEMDAVELYEALGAGQGEVSVNGERCPLSVSSLYEHWPELEFRVNTSFIGRIFGSEYVRVRSVKLQEVDEMSGVSVYQSYRSQSSRRCHFSSSKCDYDVKVIDFHFDHSFNLVGMKYETYTHTVFRGSNRPDPVISDREVRSCGLN